MRTLIMTTGSADNPLVTFRAAILLVLLSTSAGWAQTIQARLTGRVADASGAALPGVTVTIAADTLRQPVILITDDVGRYNSPVLPAGTYAVSFELAGFEPHTRERVELRAGEVVVLDRQLVVGAVTENIEVVAPAPPAPKPFPKFEAPPAPKITPVPREVLASVCGPGQPDATTVQLGTIVGHRDDKNRTIFGVRDVLLLDVGADFGAAVGQNFVVRRRFRVDDRSVPLKMAAFGEQTAALVQVVETMPAMSIAVVVYTCGEFFAGDFVEPFDPLPLLSAAASGAPHFDDPAHIIFGEHGQAMGATAQLMVIDRGTAHGAERGQRLTVFRRIQGERGPVSTIADAVVIAVRENSATIRIERASDAVTIGDLVALHR
jgi:hypothetical protein